MGSKLLRVKHYKIKLTNIGKIKKHLFKKIMELLICIFLIAIVIFILFITFKNIVLWQHDSNDTNKQTKQIYEDVVIEEVEDNENTEIIEDKKEKENEVSDTNDYWYYVKFPLINVDFSELKKKNSDTVAWVNVNNTNINYPVVQADDNDYYLNHSYNKEYNEAGWVFLDFRNNKNFTDQNTIIYAHSRLDKTMFGSLSKTLKESWYKDKNNHIIRTSNEYENSLWQIFSIYVIETEDYYITTNFDNTSDYESFLDIIRGRSWYNFNTSLTTNDRILTLSTCYDDNRKTVVHAKLLKRELR